MEIVPRWSFGVLNPSDTIWVPGSILLLAEPNQPETPTPSTTKTTPDGSIILSPQPDDSPNDPLNWPRWRRDAALAALGIYCMVGGGMTPLLAAGFTDIAADYGVPVKRVALTTGMFMLGLGLGCVVVSPTAIIYGKRPVYLASVVLFLAASVWCAESPDFVSLLLARVVQGVAVSPVEALPSASISEMFFLHERAFRIGLYGLMLLGGKNLVPLVSAAVIERLGWRWVFWVVLMVVSLCGVLLFLFVSETFWDRTPPLKNDAPDSVQPQGPSSQEGKEKREKIHRHHLPLPVHVPYRFSAFATGLVYIAPFIGGVLGTAVAGRASDLVVRAMARHNKGVYEPEFRLVMMLPVLIATVAGLMGFGWSVGGSTTAITFCLDSYRQFAGEALVTLNFSKNILHGMVFSLFITGWVQSDGPKTVFIWIGVIQSVLLTTTLPMFLYGKRARQWTAKRSAASGSKIEFK
ncbi:major facilitator superfamily domain-containing protein [Bombardia bombarda]|uniref:Major facilitator superfamily domain-containing protein n=1 Tax=Bombardia bombarda TaxID=252184 RepID=A0AA39XL14_9PEZI|nr:major facilitator superfamily domain-containing protein [Bombardia bombarda]